MKKLYLLRHGETDWNREGRTQGQRDSDLTPQGIIQAEQAAQYLSRQNIGAIYCSQLKRASETGRIVQEVLKVPLYVSERLAEVGFGAWEGLTYQDIQDQFPEELDLWHRSPHQVEIPRWEGIHQAQRRISHHIQEILDQADREEVVIISHGTIIKLYLMDFLGMDLSHFYKLRLDNCCLNVIEFLERGPVLSRYNDTSYLEILLGAEDNGI